MVYRGILPDHIQWANNHHSWETNKVRILNENFLGISGWSDVEDFQVNRIIKLKDKASKEAPCEDALENACVPSAGDNSSAYDVLPRY